MKKINKIILLTLVVLAVSFALPSPVSAAPLDGDEVIFGETYTLESGRILDGNLILVGGVVDIQPDAVVRGDVFAVGSAGTISGTIEGSLITIGGTITLDESSAVLGDIITPISHINEEEGSVIGGDKYLIWDFPLPDFFIPSDVIPEVQTSSEFQFLSLFNKIAEAFAIALAMLALAALLLLIIPKPVDVMTDALSAEPWHMLGYGALTALVMLVGGIILTITICMIPVVILAGLSFALAVLIGWLVLGYELGKRIASTIFKTTWHPVLSAVIGNLVLYLVAKGLDFIPCIGGFLVFVAALFGLGMAVVTLFGTITYPRKENNESEPIVLNHKDEKEIEVKQDDEKTGEVKKEKKSSKKTSKKSDS